jgi:pimeloyl-ACP methyl ester carboxylesterase
MTTPLFFGEASRQLFGVYHAPGTSTASGQAVLLCPAGPQEYMLTHWAQRRLAAMLAKQGLHVLRFDYFGTGDSAGSIDEGRLEVWQKDIRTAEEKLRELSGAARTSLVGYRLGATLAWRASLEMDPRPRHLVLWDPVVRGSTYLHELRLAETTFASQLLYFPPLEEPPTELFGYPIPEAQRVSTQAIDLLHEPLPAATRVHLYVGRSSSEASALSSRLAEQLKRFTFECVPEEGKGGSGNLLSKRVLDTIRLALSAEVG